MQRLDDKSPAERLSPALRVALLAIAGLGAFFLVGIMIGFGAATIDHGHLPRKPLAWGSIAGAAGLAYGLYRLIRWPLHPSLGAGLTPYGLRCSRMMGIIMLLRAPLVPHSRSWPCAANRGT